MSTAPILYLKQEDVIKAGLLDMKKILAAVEETYCLLGKGLIKNPPKVSTRIPDEENWTSFFNSMPCYIGGDTHVAGIKWACEAKGNAKLPGVPWGIDVIILSDPDSVRPLAIMDGTLVTAMRTSAVGGTFAKYTAPKGCKLATLVGAGVIGRTMIMAVCESVPTLEEIILCDLDIAKAQALAAEMEKVYNVKITATTDTAAAVKKSPLIVTMTTATKPFVFKDMVQKGATVIAMASNEIDLEVLRGADQLFVDYWAQMLTNRFKGVTQLYASGEVKESDIVEMAQLALGNHPGRTSDDQTIFCGSMGLGALDIYIGNTLYKAAKAAGIGQPLNLWDNCLWE